MNRFMLRFAAAIFLALISGVSPGAFAQDAGRVLATSVGFRTVKNTAPMDAEKRKEVEQLEAKARAANDAKKYGEALKYYSQGIALMRNQPWTPSRALTTAAELKTERAVFDPGDSVSLKLTQLFTLDEPIPGKLGGSLALTQPKDGVQQPVKELKTFAGLDPDFTSPLTIDTKIPEVADGPYQLLLKLSPVEGEPITKIVNIRVARGLNAEAAALKTRATSVKADLQKRNQRSPLQAIPAIEYAASLIDLVNAGSLGISTDIKSALARASGDLDLIAKGENPLAAKRGDIHWAYRSEVDDTLQPFRFFIPAGYDKTKKWPMIIALHGMGGDENSFFTAYNNGEIKRIAEARGYIVACPKGRAPTSMYYGSAERDVLDVIKEMKREYSIDVDRVYMMGHSMGGYGTWSVSANHPDLFAAIAPIAGGGTPFVTAKLRAAAHIPWIVIHGDKDPTVPVDESRKMVKAGQNLGIKIKYNEVPGGNHSNIVVPAFNDIFDWFDGHKRQPKNEAKAAGSSQ